MDEDKGGQGHAATFGKPHNCKCALRRIQTVIMHDGLTLQLRDVD